MEVKKADIDFNLLILFTKIFFLTVLKDYFSSHTTELLMMPRVFPN